MRGGGWQLALGGNLPGAQSEVAPGFFVLVRLRMPRKATPLRERARIVSITVEGNLNLGLDRSG